jgi:hypothetical protein
MRNGQNKRQLMIWVVISITTFIILNMPIIADDFLILINFYSSTKNEDLAASLLSELSSRFSNEDNRFLPLGWIESAGLLTFSKLINSLPFLDIENSWSIVRLLLMGSALYLTWSNFLRVQKVTRSQQYSFTTYLFILCLTIQFHALWGHDSILSYTSTVWFLLIFSSTYFMLLETSIESRRNLSKTLVLISGCLTHEIFIAVLGYLFVYILRIGVNKQNIKKHLVDLIVLGCSLIYSLVNVSTGLSDYSGVKIGSATSMPIVMTSQFLSLLPFSTWPLYIYSLFTERMILLFFVLAALSMVFAGYTFRKCNFPKRSDRILGENGYLYSLLGFLLLLITATSISEKYQSELFFIPGNTYLSYSFGWVFTPFFLIPLISYLHGRKRYKAILFLLALNFFVFVSSSMAIHYKFNVNSKIIALVSADHFTSSCEFQRYLLQGRYPTEYKKGLEKAFSKPNLGDGSCGVNDA